MKLSVIIPTYNEAGNICRLIDDLRRYGDARLAEILVVDGASDDHTVALARQAGATVWQSPQAGRAAQMNYGAGRATGDVLYFVHADVSINRTFLDDIDRAVAENYEAGCYRFRFDSTHPLLRINSYGTRFGGLMSRGGDQTLFITRPLFNRLGGFDERYVVMEDFDIIIRIRRLAKFLIIPKDVLVSARKYEHNGWLRVQVANLTAFMLFFLHVAPTRIARTYKSMLTHR